MERIFPYYEIEADSGIIVDYHDACNTISKICLNCKKFKQKKLCCSVKDSFFICDKGMSVYWDSNQNIQYFSLRVRGNYNHKKVPYRDNSFKISENFFYKYQKYINLNKADDFSNIAYSFFNNLSKILSDFLSLIGNRGNSDVGICTLTFSEVSKLNKLMDELVQIRARTMDITDSIVEKLQTFFSNDNIWNWETKFCIPRHKICSMCTNASCHSTMQENCITPCQRGLFQYTKKHVSFVGFLKGENAHSNKEDVVVLPEKILMEILNNDSWLIHSMMNFQRFLHDVAQYFVGMHSVIPDVSSNASTQVLHKDVFSLKSMIEAINALQSYMYDEIFLNSRDIKIQYEPYKLFDKYRICFSSPDTHIRITKDEKHQISLVVNGVKGLEVVVLNLLLNAIKYLPPIPFSQREIIINFSLHSDLEITLSSYGPPMSEGEIVHLGKIGYRGEVAKKYKIAGKGLGIHIAKELCERSGYQLHFNSEAKKVTFADKEYSIFKAILIIPRRYHSS